MIFVCPILVLNEGCNLIKYYVQVLAQPEWEIQLIYYIMWFTIDGERRPKNKAVETKGKFFIVHD